VNLYIGFNVSDAPFNEEAVGFYIDVDHDGGLTLQPDDITMGIHRNGTLFEGNITGGTWTPTNVSGWTASFHSTLDMWQAEFNIPYSKIDVIAGVEKTIGVAFLSNCRSLSAYPFTWPPEYIEDIQNNPSKWGDITSTGYNWIPEFPSFLILPLFMIATLLAVTIYRRKSKDLALSKA